jgi:hypothetical protein
MDVASSFLFGQNVDGLVRLEDAGKRESSELEVEEKQGAEEGVGGEELARAFSKAQVGHVIRINDDDNSYRKGNEANLLI